MLLFYKNERKLQHVTVERYKCFAVGISRTRVRINAKGQLINVRHVTFQRFSRLDPPACVHVTIEASFFFLLNFGLKLGRFFHQ